MDETRFEVPAVRGRSVARLTENAALFVEQAIRGVWRPPWFPNHTQGALPVPAVRLDCVGHAGHLQEVPRRRNLVPGVWLLFRCLTILRRRDVEEQNPWPLIVAALAVGAFLFAVIRALMPATWTATVHEGSRGLIYRHGKFEREVGPGQYWVWGGRSILLLPTNESIIAVSGQEVMTSDRLAVRMSALAKLKIVDARKAQETSSGGYHQPLYYAIQLAMREVIAGLSLESLLDTRGNLDVALKEKASAAFAHEGCELVSVAIRDLTLPAEVRRLATDVARAKLEAAASLERARGEQASLRALANAARLIKGNPELMNLRVLQALAASPGKAAPTIILGGTAGIVPVPAGAGDDGPDIAEG